MNVALVNFVPSLDPANYLGFNQGLGFISAVCRQQGHVTRLFLFEKDQKECGDFSDFSADAIFVYLATNQFGIFTQVLQTRWLPMGIPVFVGGPHATACPEELALLKGVSAVIIGEGEKAAQRLLGRVGRGEDFSGIDNVWFQKDKELIKNPTGYYEADLDALPFPDRDIFPYERVLQDRSTNLMGFEFLSTRGCIYGCRYCLNPLLRQLHGKQGCIRRRSIDNLIAEIREVTQAYNYRGIIGFHDDIFTLDKKWLRDFAAEYKAQIGLPFWCNAHIRNLNEDIIKNLRRGGCFRVHMGIECGDEQMRRSMLNKHISNREILEKVALLKKHHIKIVTTFMIGMPDETEEGIKKSIELCAQIAPDWVLLSVLCPYPGTSFYQELVEQGRVDPHFYHNLQTDTFYSSICTYQQGVLSEEKLTYYFENFRRLAKQPF